MKCLLCSSTFENHEKICYGIILIIIMLMKTIGFFRNHFKLKIRLFQNVVLDVMISINEFIFFAT